VAEQWNLVPRIMPFLGSAHVLGGVIFGTALGISGMCPGTCMAKAGGRGGEKKFVAPAAILGLIAGIFVYTWTKEPLTSAGLIATHQKPLTLHGTLGLSYGALALAFGALLLIISVTVDRLTPEKVFPLVRERKTLVDYLRGEWSWIVGGVLGGLLVVLATMQNGYLGFSGAVLAAVGWMAHFVGHPLEAVPVINGDIVWRAALIIGVFPGGLVARAFSLKSAAAVQAPVRKELSVPALVRAFVAGLVLCYGAMVGGGCTTGAFIAAWPTLSLGSFAMAGTFFAVSMAVGNLRLLVIRSLDLSQAQLAGDRAYD
jgi:hypothetical protein